MIDPVVIDTQMHRKVGITAAYVLRGEKTALLETGPKSSLEHVLAGLDAANVDHLDWIIVTHIHLDHAGAAGTLSQRFPDARVGVHEIGAPHLADPSKLWNSARRIYGERMEELWGGIDPIPPQRIHVIADQDVIDLGGLSLRAVETPGHAYHHHSFLVEEAGFVFT
ncbi:MAG TPA: MBL fold metallo-hydrolase, partial [Actinomycetota bacterium]|nr:MBL fold metallo-hydrolase [Actinomycetota bacterium]